MGCATCKILLINPNEKYCIMGMCYMSKNLTCENYNEISGNEPCYDESMKIIKEKFKGQLSEVPNILKKRAQI